MPAMFRIAQLNVAPEKLVMLKAAVHAGGEIILNEIAGELGLTKLHALPFWILTRRVCCCLSLGSWRCFGLAWLILII